MASSSTPKADSAKVKKRIPRRLLEAYVQAGLLPADQLDALVQAGVVTSGGGGGGGPSIRADLPKLGVPQADVDALYALADRISNIIKGKRRESNGRVAERLGIWIKHEGEAE